MTGGNKYLIMLDYCASLVPSGDRLNRRYVLHLFENFFSVNCKNPKLGLIIILF